MKKAEFIARYGEEAYQRMLERNKQYYQDNKEEILEQKKQYCQDNKEKIAEYRQNNKEKIAKRQKQWREDNPEYNKQYHQDNREEIAERKKQHRQTQYGRATNLCHNYQQEDKKYNRGDCTLTPDYIVEQIFPNGCLYCGEKDLTKLGCDRVDNDLPHTPDNVVCCCVDCNKKRRQKGFDMFLYKSWRKRFV